MNQLPISEIFYSIQGEGPTQGIPAVFLRLGGCNLNCGSGKNSTWQCDTLDVWKKSTKTSPEKLLELFIQEKYLEKLSNGAHLVITGGEPLLYQNGLVSFLEILTDHVSNCFIEVETNGTIAPDPILSAYISQFNVSLKLSGSGEILEKRINESAILTFTQENPEKSVFKFVIADSDEISEVKDLLETKNLFLGFPNLSIYLMPAGKTQTEINTTLPMVATLAIENGYCLSNRLHIQIWNNKKGV